MMPSFRWGFRGAFAAAGVAALVWAAAPDSPRTPAHIFTSAPKYDPQAWLTGKDRFPAGATLIYADGQKRRPVATGFYATADAAVSFDGQKALFAGKRDGAAHWQIWEIALAGGEPKQITSCDSDCVRPLYVPPNLVAYTQVAAHGSDIEIMPLAGGNATQLSYGPGWRLTDDVLRDARILFENAGASGVRDLYTVYPDGTGVESLRCDHGPDRTGAHQLAAGEVVFTSAGRFAEFVSALAVQSAIPQQPKGEPAGPVAEVAPGKWLIALRANASGLFALNEWTRANGQLSELERPEKANAVEPVLVAPRVPPRDFPSAMVTTRTNGNLLCLNAKESKEPISEPVSAVRVYTSGAGGAPVTLGQAPVERDGSFYVQVPADKPIRIELLNAAGRTVRAEREWFWMRPSEQRVCVGCHAGPERSPENKVPEVLNRTIVPFKLLGEAAQTQ